MSADDRELSENRLTVARAGDARPAEVALSAEEPAGMARRSLIGTTVGSIRVVDVAGRGGMGEVYVGYDERLARRVALKAVHAHLSADADARARFLHEARVLSQLEHPNICRVYDLVERPDQDFLVLELVVGRSLKQAIRDGLRRPLALAVAEQVANVLAAAHERGIVHRDLKPDNVMLTTDDQAKVLDFGLARVVAGDDALTHRLASVAAPAAVAASGSAASYAATLAGSLVGTPAYMSPEQARGEPATTASDMYAFGLLLQELLSGRPPCPPGLPLHTVVAWAARGERQPFSDPEREVTTLVERLTALAPAARPSAVDVVERLRSIVRAPRRRRLRLAAAVAAAALAVTAAVAVDQAVRARREAARAAREAETARQVSDFLERMFAVADPNEARGRTITAREILDQGARRVMTELADQPLVQARLMAAVGRVEANLGLYAEAGELHRRALDIRRRLSGDDPSEVADSLGDLGKVLYYQGDFAAAEPLLREALAAHETAFGAGDAAVASDCCNLADLLADRGEVDAARALFERVIASPGPALGRNHPAVVRAVNSLGVLLWSQADYAAAEPLLRRSLASFESTLPADSPELATALNNLALLLRDRGELAAARPLFERALAIDERALGPEHTTVAAMLSNLGTLEHRAGRFATARPLLERAVAISERALTPDHPALATRLNNLGVVLDELGEAAAAETCFERALASFETALGRDSGPVATVLVCVARCRISAGQPERAWPALERALAISEQAYGPDDEEVAYVLLNMAASLAARGRTDEARPPCQRAFAMLEQRLAAEPGDAFCRVMLARTLVLLGSVERAAGNPTAAAVDWERALTELRPLGVDTAGAREVAARALLLLGRVDEARPLAAELLANGFGRQDFVALCRDHGIARTAAAGG